MHKDPVEVSPFHRRDLSLAGFLLHRRWPDTTLEWSQVLALAVRVAAVPGVLATTTVFRASEDAPDVGQAVGRKVDDLARAISLEASKGSVLGYQTTRQAAKRIKADLAEKGITGFVDKAGRSWDMGRYAKVLAQETTNGAFRQGTINRFQEHGHDLVRISTHSGSCTRCIPWQGRTLSISGNDPDYPSLAEAQGAGLLHVGCLHVLSLAPEEKDRYIAGLAERAAAIRNA